MLRPTTTKLKPRVFLCGTDRVKDVINEVYKFLRIRGFDPIWFQKPDFLSTANYSMDNCIEEAKRCHRMIVIIDERAGLRYQITGTTICEAEFMTAVKRSIPFLIFVREEVLNNSKIYHRHRTASGGALTVEAFKTLKLTGDQEVFEFIERIQHLEQNGSPSVPWITSFKFVDDIKKVIRVKWKSAIQSTHPLVPYSPNFELGFAGTPTLEFRQKAVHIFEAKRPDMIVHLDDEPADKCQSGIIANELHMALIPQPITKHPSLEFEPLVDYPIRVIVGAGHRLFNDTQVHAADLENEEFVAFSKLNFSQYHDYLERLLGFSPRIAREYDDDEELLSAVDRNHGIALMLPTVELSGHYNFAFLQLVPEPPLIRIGALYTKGKHDINHEFISCAREALAEIADANGETPFGGKVCRLTLP